MGKLPSENVRGPLASLRGEVSRLFEDFWGGDAWCPAPFGQGRWSPALDVAETDQEVVVKADLPGIDPKDISITVSGDVLSIQGEKTHEAEQEGKSYHRIERRYGSFSRQVHLPTAVDTDRIEAKASEGVLTITLPKRPEVQPRKINIQAQ